MAYNKTVWQDLPSTATPINATNLNNIENGIENLETEIGNINTEINNINTNLDNIFEIGSNANGEYIKYSNGILICLKEVDLTGSVQMTAQGDLYRTPNLSLGDWAVPFLSKPYSVAQQTGGTTLVWIAYRTGISTTSAGEVVLLRAGSILTQISTTVSVIGIGKWK